MSATRSTQSETARATKTAAGPRQGSVMWAAIQVLDGKRTPMTPAAILAEVQQRKLATGLGGKTPEATVAARLAVHTAKGLYVERPEKGKYRLKKGVTAKALSSGATAAPAGRARTAATRGARRARGA